MQVLAQARNGVHGSVGDLPALVENEVAQAWGCLNDLLDARILQLATVRQVEDAQAIKSDVLWKVEEGHVGDS